MWNFNSPKAYVIAACAAFCWAGIYAANNAVRDEELAGRIDRIPAELEGQQFLSDEPLELPNPHVAITEVVPGGEVVWEQIGRRSCSYTYWVVLFQLPNVAPDVKRFVPLPPPPDAEPDSVADDDGPRMTQAELQAAIDRLADRGIHSVDGSKQQPPQRQLSNGPPVLIAACHRIYNDGDYQDVVMGTEFDGYVWDDSERPPSGVMTQLAESYPGVDLSSLRVLHVNQYVPTVEEARGNFRFGVCMAAISAFAILICLASRFVRDWFRERLRFRQRLESRRQQTQAEGRLRDIAGSPDQPAAAGTSSPESSERPPEEFAPDAVIWPTAAGFYIRVDGQMRPFRDMDVLAISFRSRMVEGDGHKVRRHSLELKIDDSGTDRHVSVELDVALGDEDEVTPFRNRLEQTLSDGLWERLRANELISGPDWTLTRTALTSLDAGAADTLRVDSILHAGWTGETFQVWATGRDMPFLELRAGEENVSVLASLLMRLATEGAPLPVTPADVDRPATYESSASELDPLQTFNQITAEVSDSPYSVPHQPDDLGVFLSEFKQPNRFAMVCVGAALLGVYATYFNDLPGSTRLKLFLGIIPLLLSYGICEIVPRFKDRLRHHANGIRILKGGVFGFGATYDLPFSELGLFASRQVDHYQNGVYTGTINDLTFGPADLSRRFRFKLTFRHGDTNDSRINQLREEASAAVAESLRRQLREHGSVAWTPSLTIHHDHLTHHGRLRREPVRIPLTDIVDIDVVEGRLTLWHGPDQRRLSEQADADNFFPGLQLLTTLLPGRSIGAVGQTVVTT